MNHDQTIFVCHDCSLATKQVTNNIKNITQNDRLFPLALSKFKERHQGHDTAFYPDLSGQYRPQDYDFKMRKFRWVNWW